VTQFQKQRRSFLLKGCPDKKMELHRVFGFVSIIIIIIIIITIFPKYT